MVRKRKSGGSAASELESLRTARESLRSLRQAKESAEAAARSLPVVIDHRKALDSDAAPAHHGSTSNLVATLTAGFPARAPELVRHDCLPTRIRRSRRSRWLPLGPRKANSTAVVAATGLARHTSPSSEARSRASPSRSRDLAVPSGMPRTSATSR